MSNIHYTYRILPPAQSDFREGKEWYRSRKVRGLSARFNKAVLEAIGRIQERPFAYAMRYRNVRVCHTEIFPYAIHFIIDEGSARITITAIIYDGRNPDISMSRKQEEEDNDAS